MLMLSLTIVHNVCQGEDLALQVSNVFIKPMIEGALALPCEKVIGDDLMILLTRAPVTHFHLVGKGVTRVEWKYLQFHYPSTIVI